MTEYSRWQKAIIPQKKPWKASIFVFYIWITLCLVSQKMKGIYECIQDITWCGGFLFSKAGAGFPEFFSPFGSGLRLATREICAWFRWWQWSNSHYAHKVNVGCQVQFHMWVLICQLPWWQGAEAGPQMLHLPLISSHFSVAWARCMWLGGEGCHLLPACHPHGWGWRWGEAGRLEVFLMDSSLSLFFCIWHPAFLPNGKSCWHADPLGPPWT